MTRVIVPRPKTEPEFILGDDDIEIVGNLEVEDSNFDEEVTEENTWYRHLVKNRGIS